MTRHPGFTLVDLLTVIAVATVLAGIAIPAFSRSLAANQRIAATNALLGAVQYARAEAIQRGREVVLCPSLTGERCVPGVTDWVGGYLVFVDDPPGPPYQLTDSRLRLRSHRWPARIQISANREQFVFRPLARRSTNGTFQLCHPHPGVLPRALIVAPTGRPRVSSRLADGGIIACPPP
ncbi:MAG: GspH/FimT family pseudopilin [Pseudomonadota bacterium]